MKKILLLFSIIIFSLNSFSQALAFRVTYPNVTISSVSQTADNGYIIAGHSTAYSIGSKDIVLIKTDSTGAVTWTKTFGNRVNANADDIPANAVEIPAGIGYYLAGQFWNQTNNTYEVYILKTDVNGNRLWSKTMYNGGYDKGMRVDNAAGGGCLVTGWLGNSSKGYLCHLDANGNIIWQNSVFYFAGTWILQSGRPTPDGGMISCGYDNELGAYEMWLLRTNSAGAILWQRGYAMSTTYNFSYDVCLTADSGYMLAGGSNGINLAKTDGNGNLQWAKTYSSISASTTRAYSVRQCQDMSFIILANDLNNNQYLVKTDSAGNMLWTKKYTGGYFINTVEQTSDGGYALAIGSDMIKTDANGVTGCGETSFMFIASPLTLVPRTTGATNVSQAQNNIAADSSTSPLVTISTCFPTGTGIPANKNGVIIFPNPATNELRIENLELKIKGVEIYTLFGEKIFPSPLAPLSFRRGVGGEVILNVSPLSTGIYFLKIRDEDGNEATAKFVKM